MAISVNRIALVVFNVWSLSVIVQSQTPDIVFTLKEELNPGVFIGNLAVDSGVGQDVAVEEFPYLEYNFLNPNNKDVKSLFSINRLTGAVYSTQKIDREVLCNNSVVCHVTFDITIQSSATTFLRLLSVRVNIEDINDNAPEFDTTSLSIDISESVVLGTSFRINGATDKDMGSENTVQSYELVQPNATFGVQLIRKFDGSTDVSLAVLQPLDRETQDVHSILILAKDNGSPQRSGTLLVNVNVIDVNDNTPQFMKSVYNVSAQENTPIGALTETLSAFDLDSGKHANLSYRFSPLRSSKLEHLFDIEESTGKLSVKSPLEYESGKTYETIVEVSDNGNPPLVSQTILIVNIIDVGNNPPRLQLNLATSMDSEVIFLSEGSKVGTFVGHIKVEDRDPGVNGVVTCTCEQSHFTLQKLGGKGYALLISEELDRETIPRHNVTVTCMDNGNPQLGSSLSFVVVITDQNDNGPKFLKSHYVMNVTENTDIDTVVGSVLAIDNDLDENAEFYYTLEQESTAMFHINSETGILTTRANIDRETYPKITFVVKAIDNQNARLTGTASVTVNIIDLNDNSPAFVSDSLRIKAIESLQPGTKLSKLVATDADIGKNAMLSYAAEDRNAKVPFVVYEDGTIRLESSLNREIKTVYEFDVIVQDKGDIPRTTVGRVVIKVVDANDHSPVIEFPNTHNNTVKVNSSAIAGSQVSAILASDKDGGDNGDLEYFIISGNEDKLFQISPKSGEIILIRDILPDDVQLHQLKIQVKDQGAIRLEDTALLRIEIVQWNSPVAPSITFSSGQMYLIITGIVAGVTIILAIIIVTVIIRMKRSERNVPDSEDASSHKDDHGFDKVQPGTALPNTSMNSGDSHLEFHPVKNGENDIIFTNNKTHIDPSEGRKTVSFIFSQVNGRVGSNDNKSNFSEESNGSDSGKGCSDDENATLNISETAPSVIWQKDVKDIIPPVPPKNARYQAYNTSNSRSQLPHVQFLESFTRKPLQTNNSFKESHKETKDFRNKKSSDSSKSSSRKENWAIQNSFYQENKCFKDNLRHYPGHEALPSLSYNSLCHSSVCSIDDDQYSTTSGSYTINSDNEDSSFVY